jgi:hypothetical protein
MNFTEVIYTAAEIPIPEACSDPTKFYIQTGISAFFALLFVISEVLGFMKSKNMTQVGSILILMLKAAAAAVLTIKTGLTPPTTPPREITPPPPDLTKPPAVTIHPV